MNDKELFSHSATILRISDMDRSMSFYIDRLGFNPTFTWKEPVEYAVLKRGDISIHLSLSDGPFVVPDGVLLYIFVYDIESVYKECLDKQVPITSPLETRDYMMRDFDIKDPDGYLICFGQGQG